MPDDFHERVRQYARQAEAPHRVQRELNRFRALGGDDEEDLPDEPEQEERDNGEWFQAPEIVFRQGVPNLEPVPMPPIPDEPEMKEYKRPGPLLPYKISYQSYDDVRLRLANSIIDFGEPWYVQNMRNIDGSGNNTLLCLWQPDKKRDVLFKNIPDVRSPTPGYIQYDGRVAFLNRKPLRDQKQGMHAQNSSVYNLAGRRLEFNDSEVIQGLLKRDVTLWEDIYLKLINKGVITGVRLTNNLAVDSTCQLHYKGRLLGSLDRGKVSFACERDKTKPWIKNELLAVQLPM